MSLIALGVTPYITASIIIQLCTSLVPSLMTLKKEGETGRKKLNQYTRYGTVLLTAIQGYGIAVGLEGWGAGTGVAAVINPGIFFQVSTVITLIGGTMFLMWLGESDHQPRHRQRHFADHHGRYRQPPAGLGRQLFEQTWTGAISLPFILMVAVLGLGTIAFICVMERAQRKILIQDPKRQVGTRQYQGDSSFRRSRSTPAASSTDLRVVAAADAADVAQFLGKGGNGPDWLLTVTTELQRGAPVYMALYAAGIIFFSFFYTAVVFNPEETAENLKKYGGFIPGIRPGVRDERISRLCAEADHRYRRGVSDGDLPAARIPDVEGRDRGELRRHVLLIIVNVTMDTVAQIQSHLLAHQYEGLIKKSKLRGIRR